MRPSRSSRRPCERSARSMQLRGRRGAYRCNPDSRGAHGETTWLSLPVYRGAPDSRGATGVREGCAKECARRPYARGREGCASRHSATTPRVRTTCARGLRERTLRERTLGERTLLRPARERPCMTRLAHNVWFPTRSAVSETKNPVTPTDPRARECCVHHRAWARVQERTQREGVRASSRAGVRASPRAGDRASERRRVSITLKHETACVHPCTSYLLHRVLSAITGSAVAGATTVWAVAGAATV